MAGPISPDKLGLFVVSTAEGTDGKVLASKFRQLRLETLKGDPNSWLSNYDAEVELPIEHWLAHLQHPLRTVFVCVRKTSSSAESESPSLLNDEWIGVVELIGPYPAAKWHWPQASPLHYRRGGASIPRHRRLCKKGPSQKPAAHFRSPQLPVQRLDGAAGTQALTPTPHRRQTNHQDLLSPAQRPRARCYQAASVLRALGHYAVRIHHACRGVPSQ